MKKIIFLTTFVCIVQVVFSQSITPEWLWSLDRISVQDVSEKHNKIIYQLSTYDVADNNSTSKIYTMNLDGSDKAVLYDDEDKIRSVSMSPVDNDIYYLKGGLLYKMNMQGQDHIKVSDIKMNGYRISPDGKHVAYTADVKTTETLKDKYNQYDQAEAYMFDDLMYRHWDHWEDDKHSNLFVATLDNEKLSESINIVDGPYDVPLKPFGGMGQINWSSDSKAVFFSMKNLTGMEYALSTDADIYKYDLSKRTLVNLTEENPGYDLEPQFSKDGKWMVYNSMATAGYEADKNRIILVDLKRGEQQDITVDFDESANHPKFSPDGKNIYFTAGKEATYQLFSYELSSKKIKQITEGVHNINDFYPTSKTVICTRTSMTDASDIYAVNKKGGFQQLTQVNKSAYANIKKAKVKSKWINTTDGKKMKVWHILPPDFDPDKKYPTLLYCQGGPQSAVSQFFSYRWNFQLMAAQGYVIVAPNRRGLPSFGTEWNEAISGDWGGQAMEDYLSAIDDAIEHDSYVDKDRVGAIGASYGGYSVYWLAGNHDKRFKTFISHCGLFNLESWYGTTEELFFANHDLGGPYWEQEHKAEYEKFSPHTYAANWDTPILVIHGGKDYRVPLSEGMQAFQVAQLKGIKSKFLYFPNEGHWILSPQNAMVWQKEFFSWLDETLKK